MNNFASGFCGLITVDYMCHIVYCIILYTCFPQHALHMRKTSRLFTLVNFLFLDLFIGL